MITQRLRVYKNSTAFQTFETGSLFSGMRLYELTTLPAWITKGGFNPWISFISVNSTTPSVGEYTYYFTLSGSPSIADACLIVEIVSTASITNVDNCTNPLNKNLVWITREGGKASYIFDQRKNFSVKAGDSKTFETANNELKYINRGKVFDNVTVYKSGLTQNEIDYLSSLRNSIQAWEYNETTGELIPIVLKEDDYDTYNTKTNFYELSITYSYAKYKQIQNG